MSVKIVAGLGNPGPEYDATRHNVGWWVVDRVCHDWGLGSFQRVGGCLVAEGTRGDERVILLKPIMYMNRSGPALRPWLVAEGIDVAADLLVVVDDVALDVGKVRFRPDGRDGGHKGLRSVQGVLGHDSFPRLRIGVGIPPQGGDLVEWVLSPLPDDAEDQVLSLLPHMSEGIDLWVREGIEPTMSRFNR
jgi:PTH1 family peptidyl-tRNA hydrolase